MQTKSTLPLKSAQQLSDEEALRRTFAPVTNRSRATRVAKALLGPLGYAWVLDATEVAVGEQHPDGTKVIFGSGPTWGDAFCSAAKDVPVKEIAQKAGPELRAVHSADARAAQLRVRT